MGKYIVPFRPKHKQVRPNLQFTPLSEINPVSVSLRFKSSGDKRSVYPSQVSHLTKSLGTLRKIPSFIDIITLRLQKGGKSFVCIGRMLHNLKSREKNTWKIYTPSGSSQNQGWENGAF